MQHKTYLKKKLNNKVDLISDVYKPDDDKIRSEFVVSKVQLLDHSKSPDIAKMKNGINIQTFISFFYFRLQMQDSFPFPVTSLLQHLKYLDNSELHKRKKKQFNLCPQSYFNSCHRYLIQFEKCCSTKTWTKMVINSVWIWRNYVQL